MDGIQNGTEADVDCGGADCAPCSDHMACNVDSDCKIHVCSSGVCQPATCTDGVLNGDETDIDCGGSNCPPCDPGSSCEIDTDCQSGARSAGVCESP